jgi:hypothetical protein
MLGSLCYENYGYRITYSFAQTGLAKGSLIVSNQESLQVAPPRCSIGIWELVPPVRVIVSRVPHSTHLRWGPIRCFIHAFESS